MALVLPLNWLSSLCYPIVWSLPEICWVTWSCRTSPGTWTPPSWSHWDILETCSESASYHRVAPETWTNSSSADCWSPSRILLLEILISISSSQTAYPGMSDKISEMSLLSQESDERSAWARLSQSDQELEQKYLYDFEAENYLWTWNLEHERGGWGGLGVPGHPCVLKTLFNRWSVPAMMDRWCILKLTTLLLNKMLMLMTSTCWKPMLLCADFD